MGISLRHRRVKVTSSPAPRTSRGAPSPNPALSTTQLDPVHMKEQLVQRSGLPHGQSDLSSLAEENATLRVQAINLSLEILTLKLAILANDESNRERQHRLH